MMAVVRRMVAVSAALVVAVVSVPTAPAVAAVVDCGIAHRFLIAGIAVAQPAGISGPHATLVELDAIVVTPAAAGTIALPALVGGDVLVAIRVVGTGIGGADQDETGKGGEDERLLSSSLLRNAWKPFVYHY